MTFYERLNKDDVIIFDGAMGTELQKLDLTEKDWDGRQGCSEILNLTAPDKIMEIHKNYLAVGADVVETNSFGANLIVLKEYNLEDKILELNEKAALIARAAVDSFSTENWQRFVAGSMGPGTRIPSLEQISYDELYESYFLQASGLIKGKVDLFIIETCQDLLQIKACLNAVKDSCKKYNYKVPIIVSVTVEQTGTMLIGSDISAAVTVLNSLDVEIMGLNCATGPDAMTPHVKYISENFKGNILVMPNAGLPQNINGKLVYNLKKEDFSEKLLEFVGDFGVKIVGGCCGTSPEYIAKLAEKVRGLSVKKRNVNNQPAVASIYTSQPLIQNPKPFYIGERTNANGSKKFREMLLANDWDGVVDVAKEQERSLAHSIDLCVAYTGTDEIANMKKAVKLLSKQVTVPLVIDSTNVQVIEEALKCYAGKAIINSINLEDGEEKADRICKLAKRYGASLIALVIDEQGMAKDVEKKVKIAKRLYDIAVNKNGVPSCDLIYDALTFTLASGDEEMKTAGINTLEGIKKIKEELPGVFTVLGVSNISFGLKPYPREILNSVFLHEAVSAGLDLAIVNVKQIIPFFKIPKEDVEKALDLIYNRTSNALFDFISYFDKQTGVVRDNKSDDDLTLDQKIRKRVLDGSKAGLEELLKEKLKTTDPLIIINELLISAMKEVGELFGKGELQLPFVLQSAEVMKHAVDILKPFIKKSDESVQKTLVLATVKGDVHDIGKNLVDIILTNNGYKVYNIGIKCEIETIYKKAVEVNADAIGMSGLLVKSTQIMKENIEYLKEKNCNIPILLGGAALTPSYVVDVCSPIIDAPVIYCANAFDGLKAMNAIKDNSIKEFALAEKLKHSFRKKEIPHFSTEQGERKIELNVKVPQAPFFGSKVIEDIDLNEVYKFLTEEVIFRGRWGYRRGKLSKEEYDNLIEKEVRPVFDSLKREAKEKKLLTPKVIYGYYECNSFKDEVIVYLPNTNEELARFRFPRQIVPPYLCIADYFKPLESKERDLIAFQIVTVGSRATEYSSTLYSQNRYKDYLLFHGFSVEVAEALAELVHKKIREELGITDMDGKVISDFINQKYRGSRYSFGYPACPNLEGNKIIYNILDASRIGISLTEDLQMVPEQTTSAFIVHHPQAKYFKIE